MHIWSEVLHSQHKPISTNVVSNMSNISGPVGVNGATGPKYSVPREAALVLQEGILDNPLISKYLPSDIKRVSAKTRFVGKEKPTLPVNWRIAESASALHALEAALIGLLLEKKYRVSAPEVEINP